MFHVITEYPCDSVMFHVCEASWTRPHALCYFGPPHGNRNWLAAAQGVLNQGHLGPRGLFASFQGSSSPLVRATSIHSSPGLASYPSENAMWTSNGTRKRSEVAMNHPGLCHSATVMP